MQLLVDIGNTYVVIAEYDAKIKHTYRIGVDSKRTADEYGIYLDNMLKDEYDGVMISSITPSVTNTFVEYFNSKNIPTYVVGPGIKTGVNLKVNNPREVGADIICNLATLTEEQHVIVVDFGTCTSISVMRNGTLLGVNIAAGIRPSLEGMVQSAELLHLVDLPPQRKQLGVDTVSAIQIGVVKGHAYMVEGFIDELKEPNSRIVFTGGYAETINDTLNQKYEVQKHLLLEGLHKIYKRNKR